MADNNFVFKVLAVLSDTEYFTFFFLPLTGGGRALSEKFIFFFLNLALADLHDAVEPVLYKKGSGKTEILNLESHVR